VFGNQIKKRRVSDSKGAEIDQKKDSGFEKGGGEKEEKHKKRQFKRQ